MNGAITSLIVFGIGIVIAFAIIILARREIAKGLGKK